MMVPIADAGKASSSTEFEDKVPSILQRIDDKGAATTTTTTTEPSSGEERHPYSDYEEVHVRAQGERLENVARPRYAPVRLPGKAGKLYELMTSKKWLLVLGLMGTIMLILGALSGVGLYMAIKSGDSGDLEVIEYDLTRTIVQQCRKFFGTNWSQCIVEVLAEEKDQCNRLCHAMEWLIEVDGVDDDIVSFHYANELLPFDYHIQAGTPCGLNATCNMHGRCSGRPGMKTGKDGRNTFHEPPEYGNWTPVCRQNDPIDCVSFRSKIIPTTDDAETGKRNITFDEARSRAAWSKLATLESCERQRHHCDSYIGVAAVELRVQFRQCDTSLNRGLKCPGDPMTTYSCGKCPDEPNSSRITDAAEEICRGTPINFIRDGCAVVCPDKNVRAMPIGLECGEPKSGKYCLLGTCYNLTTCPPPIECKTQ